MPRKKKLQEDALPGGAASVSVKRLSLSTSNPCYACSKKRGRGLDIFLQGVGEKFILCSACESIVFDAIGTEIIAEDIDGG